jgi:outer membrane protein TolC
LTLEQCIAKVRACSPRPRIAAKAVEAARLAEREIAASLLPRIKLSAGASYSPHNDILGYDPALSAGGTDTVFHKSQEKNRKIQIDPQVDMERFGH